jgi:hypothetical protein
MGTMININNLYLETFTTSSGEKLVNIPFGYFKEVENWTEEQFLEAYKPQQWNEIRKERNKLLAESDWTQLSDVPLTTEESTQWSTYRQLLRDITTQEDPYNISWPSKF